MYANNMWCFRTGSQIMYWLLVAEASMWRLLSRLKKGIIHYMHFMGLIFHLCTNILLHGYSLPAMITVNSVISSFYFQRLCCRHIICILIFRYPCVYLPHSSFFSSYRSTYTIVAIYFTLWFAVVAPYAYIREIPAFDIVDSHPSDALPLDQERRCISRRPLLSRKIWTVNLF